VVLCKADKAFAAIEKASKAHAKAAKELAAAVYAEFPKGVRVRVPIGKSSAEGIIVGAPDPSDPERVPVSLNAWRPYKRNIHYSLVEIIDDLFVGREQEIDDPIVDGGLNG
jgi:hypothetical protein